VRGKDRRQGARPIASVAEMARQAHDVVEALGPPVVDVQLDRGEQAVVEFADLWSPANNPKNGVSGLCGSLSCGPGLGIRGRCEARDGPIWLLCVMAVGGGHGGVARGVVAEGWAEIRRLSGRVSSTLGAVDLEDVVGDGQ
jgi:hypothetical protein